TNSITCSRAEHLGIGSARYCYHNLEIAHNGLVESEHTPIA
ncbi:MAG: hypothetical protein ACI8VW_003597, partial [bacterium]